MDEGERTYERVVRYVYPSGRHANSSTDSSGRQKDDTAAECLCSRYYRPKRKCEGGHERRSQRKRRTQLTRTQPDPHKELLA